MLGHSCGQSIINGEDNTCLGTLCGNTIETGSDNVCVGAGSNVDSASALNRIAIGRNSSCTANHSAVIGNGNVAIVKTGGGNGGPLNLASIQTGSGTPVSIATVDFIGQLYIDTSGKTAYIATSTNNANWKQITPEL